MRTHVAFPDGAAIESRQASNVGVQLPGAGSSDGIARLRSAVGTARMFPSEDRRFGTWPVVLRVTDQEYERYGRVPGRLSATVDFFLNESRLVGTIPLVARATLHDGSRLVLKKLRSDYDPHNKAEALRLLTASHDTGNLVTGLFYIDTERPNFIDLLNLVDAPLATLPESRTRPPKSVLDEVMDSLR